MDKVTFKSSDSEQSCTLSTLRPYHHDNTGFNGEEVPENTDSIRTPDEP